MKITRFEEIPVWKLSLVVTKLIYDLTAKRDFENDFGLKYQLRRAIVSISSNIVEGFEKSNNNEFIRYLKIAKGSAGEVRNQIYIAKEVKYLTKQDFELLNDKLLDISKQIGGLINYLSNKRRNKEFTIR